MSYFWVKYKESIVLLLLAAFCLLLIGSPLNKQINVLRNLFLYLVNPSQTIVTELIQDNTNLSRNILSLIRQREENLNLQEEVYRLKNELIRSREAQSENDRLKNLLVFKKEASPSAQAARVIASDPANCYTSLWLDKGADDGIQLNMVAIAYQRNGIGVVGRIVELLPQTSRLLLITDQESGIRVTDQRSRYDGEAQGENSNDLRLRYFLDEADLQTGDILVTSGKGGVFPPGLVVGKVAKAFLEEDKLFKGGSVVPEIDPGLLEEVLLLPGRRNQP
jgi:rod shape-determining protein MreC